MTEQPVFYFDLGSPYAYLAAERIHKVLPVVPVWQPILLGGIWQETGGQSWAGHRRTRRRHGRGRAPRRRVRPHADPLARRVADQHAQGHARRHLRRLHRPRRRLLPRRLPPGLRRRQGSLGRRQRPHRRRGLRAPPERGAQGHRDSVGEGQAQARPPRRPTTAAFAASPRSPSGTSSSTATTASRRQLPPWPRRNVGVVSRRFSRKHGGGAAPLIAAGVGAGLATVLGARGAARVARGLRDHAPQSGVSDIEREPAMGTLRTDGYQRRDAGR